MNAPGSCEAMSKKLEKRVVRLARKAQNRAVDIKRAVRNYGDAQADRSSDKARQTRSQLEIERAVVKYNEAQRALRRLKKKIELKAGDTRNRDARSLQAR